MQDLFPAWKGSHVWICGAGAWQLIDGPDLSWTQGNNWRAAVELPCGTVYEYKYVLLDSQSGQALTWQRGNNSVLAIKAGEESIEVADLCCPTQATTDICLPCLMSEGDGQVAVLALTTTCMS